MGYLPLQVARSPLVSHKRSSLRLQLCGQAPSDHPEFAQFLVDCGIDTISVTPDSFIAVKKQVAEAEATRKKGAA